MFVIRRFKFVISRLARGVAVDDSASNIRSVASVDDSSSVHTELPPYTPQSPQINRLPSSDPTYYMVNSQQHAINRPPSPSPTYHTTESNTNNCIAVSEDDSSSVHTVTPLTIDQSRDKNGLPLPTKKQPEINQSSFKPTYHTDESQQLNPLLSPQWSTNSVSRLT